MRSLSYLCLLIVLFCGGLTVRAAIAECRRHPTEHTSAASLQKVLSCDQKLRHNRQPQSPETVITTSRPSVIVSLKNDSRDGAGTAREYLLTRITIFTCKVQAIRLLPDLHAIVRSLIYPKHIFW